VKKCSCLPESFNSSFDSFTFIPVSIQLPIGQGIVADKIDSGLQRRSPAGTSVAGGIVSLNFIDARMNKYDLDAEHLPQGSRLYKFKTAKRDKWLNRRYAFYNSEKARAVAKGYRKEGKEGHADAWDARADELANAEEQTAAAHA
jgi:hypothetical protein